MASTWAETLWSWIPNFLSFPDADDIEEEDGAGLKVAKNGTQTSPSACCSSFSSDTNSSCSSLQSKDTFLSEQPRQSVPTQQQGPRGLQIVRKLPLLLLHAALVGGIITSSALRHRATSSQHAPTSYQSRAKSNTTVSSTGKSKTKSPGLVTNMGGRKRAAGLIVASALLQRCTVRLGLSFAHSALNLLRARKTPCSRQSKAAAHASGLQPSSFSGTTSHGSHAGQWQQAAGAQLQVHQAVALKQQQQHLPFWVTPDVQARLERQTSGDTQKMETMITKISAWREQTGINTLVAAWSLLSSSKASVSHAHQLHGSSHLPPEASGAQSHAKGAAAGEAHPTPAILTAALRFQLVKQALGYSLVAAQDGFAVLLLKASSFAGVRSALAATSPPAQAGQPLPPAAGDSWRSEVGLHMGIMSEWLWAVRLAGQPLDRGRFIEVIDLSGLTLGTALGEGRMVLSAILGTAHAYPQRLAAILLTNPPPGAGILWRAITPLLPPAIAAKLRLVRGGPQAVHEELSRWVNTSTAELPTELGGSLHLATSTPALQQELDQAIAAAASVLQQGGSQVNLGALIEGSQLHLSQLRSQLSPASSGASSRASSQPNQDSSGQSLSHTKVLRRLLHWSFGDLGIVTSWQHVGGTLARGKQALVSTLRGVLDKVASVVLAIAV